MSSLRDSGKGFWVVLFCYKHVTPAGVWILFIKDGKIKLEIIISVILNDRKEITSL
jgi:hypothetical protein